MPDYPSLSRIGWVIAMRLESEVGLDVSVLEAVLACGDAEARMTLARQLAALVAGPESPQIERDQVVPILLKITTDSDPVVRRVLAVELANIKNLHADLIFSIIADEDAIALPFLLQTPALNAWHMQAILRVGDDGRQAAVARRKDLTPDAVAYIVKAATAAAVIALLENRAVKLEAVDVRQIYQRLGKAGDVVEKLLARPDLPLDIRILQAKRAAVRMRQMMAERNWMPANDASELVADAEEVAILNVLAEASEHERREAMNFLATQNMLTPSLIVRAACLGEMQIVSAALSHLTGQSAARIHELIATRGASGIKSLVGRSGLPGPCHALLAAASEVENEARNEGINLDPDAFGRRLLETLMMQFGALPLKDQAKHIEFVGRFGDDKVRKIARKLKADMLRAA